MTAASSAPVSPALSATASSARRTSGRSAPTRAPNSSPSTAGTGSAAPISGTPRSSTARPSSTANSGLPPEAANTCRATRRGSGPASRPASRALIAPKLSGPSSTRATPVGSSTCSSSAGRPDRRETRNRTS